MDLPVGIEENVPLAPLTTLKVGGPARYFVTARTEDDVFEAFEFAGKNDLPLFVLGGGSNLLIADAGFDGLVLHVALKGISPNPEMQVTAKAGEDWDGFVQFCVERELAGIEALSGIPGFVGGTPVQNVGAYGQEVSETIVSVRCYDRKTQTIINLSNSECGFSYRTSIFNTTERERYVVLSVTYRLVAGGDPKIAYRDLSDHFGGRTPSLAEAREAVIAIRRSKSMVIDPADPNTASAGSFFKNPIISSEKYSEISEAFDGDVPKFPAGSDTVKVPAAWLIEQSGFHRGFRLGNAGISSRHTLAIVNYGGATAAEVVRLKELIQERVDARFGIVLQPEPVFVGF